MNFLRRILRADKQSNSGNARVRRFFPVSVRRKAGLIEARAKALASESAWTGEDMNALTDAAGTVNVFAGGASEGDAPTERMAEWARALVGCGERAVTVAEIENSLRELDENEMLLSEEINSAPKAVCLAAAEAFCLIGECVLSAQEARVRAEKWVRSGEDIPYGNERPEFFEHALRLSADESDANRRQAVIERLKMLGRNENECVASSQEEQAKRVNGIENLVSVMRAFDNIDWNQVFEAVSFTHKTLMKDPACVYPRMDEESRDAVLTEIARISRRTGCAERMLATMAVEIADGDTGVCGVIYTDEGRKRLMARLNMPTGTIEKQIPDPNGTVLISLTLAAFLGAMMIARYAVQSTISCIVAIPAAWMIAAWVSNRLLSVFSRPKPLLKLDMTSVPDESRTLVTIPALISSPERGKTLLMQLEAMGALDDNENVDFLLLGDFPDGKAETNENDGAILDAVRSGIASMNARAERPKYRYLHRKRVKNESDGIWMGHERKRGALNDLNRLILTGENRFTAEGADASVIAGRFTYVVTVDADTDMIPGTVEKLIGTIAHPVNKAYSIIQPRMEIAANRVRNRFMRMMAGAGGSDTYHCCAPNLQQDFCGTGAYNGKGIYNVARFASRTDGLFDDNTILSHDLIEGIAAGTAYAGDISLFEGFPQTPSAYLKRQERWTRGDWQLIRYLFGKIPLSALGRFRMIDNLLRSLYEPSFMALLVLSVWRGSVRTALFAAATALMPLILSRFRGLTAAGAKFLLMPSLSAVQEGAILRALYRTFVSHRRMLDWVTAADADNLTGGRNTAGIAQAILLIPALARPAWLFFAIPLAAAFVFGREALDALTKGHADTQFALREYGMLMSVARDTWKYFERFVPLSGNGLPPDNVQLEPPKGPATRTSPTNIGLYMASCVAAKELGLIDEGEMRARLRETVSTIEVMDKWRGLIFNWYDTKTLKPLAPRYVSSVDCGNLLASLVIARNALSESDELRKRICALIAGMDLPALYDPARRLFRIGYDADGDRMSASHYDLLASESRILSYVAMAEKGIPIRHWERLGRPWARVHGGSGLVSWSGTMFEYLMPFLFMPSSNGSLLGVSAKSVVRAQMRAAFAAGKPWGVSECAYHAFDAELNYQYRAFGVSSLAISDSSSGNVIAPYATCLALCAEPGSATENLFALTREGLKGEYGFYEAKDYETGDVGEVVFCYMSHHQGMALCALANALTGNRISEIFMSGAKEKALEALLNEKPFSRPRLFAGKTDKPPASEALKARNPLSGMARTVRGGSGFDGMLLFGGDSTVYLSADGSGFLRRKGVYANLWHGDPIRYTERILPRVFDGTGEIVFDSAVFDAGCATFAGKSAEASYEMTACVSPENGAFLVRVRADARGSASVDARVLQSFEVALADENAMHSHPAFYDLFLTEESFLPGVVRFRRRKREENENDCALIHAVFGGEIAESAITQTRPLKPQSARETRLSVPAGAVRRAYFTVSLLENPGAFFPESFAEADFVRALSLSRARARTLASFCGVTGLGFRALNRDVSKIVCAWTEPGNVTLNRDGMEENRLSAKPGEVFRERLNGRELWKYGIAGDQPLLVADAFGKRGTVALRKMISAHAYYESAGLTVSLVVILGREDGYLTPIRDRVESMIAACHLNGKRNCPGGVYVLNAASLTKEENALIYALRVNRPRKSAREKKRMPAEVCDRPLESIDKRLDNGIGGFIGDGQKYAIDLAPGKKTPAPWVNILANPRFGALVTERGGGFVWKDNSRMNRLTPFDNNPAREGRAVRLYAFDGRGEFPLTPEEGVRTSFRVTHTTGETEFECVYGQTRYRATWFVDAEESVLVIALQANGNDRIDRVRAEIDWLMGTDVRDRRLTRPFAGENACCCLGKAPGVGFLTVKGSLNGGIFSDDAVEFSLGADGSAFVLVGWAESAAEAERLIERYDCAGALEKSREYWKQRLTGVQIRTDDPILDGIVNGFAKYQALACRVFARTGLYQPGGAFGLRDQLQDMLCVLYMDAHIVRAHILECAGHQFSDGDGMHWWHAPSSGVRTRISDDVLFLPFVTAEYVLFTGDREILNERCEYLKSVSIPDGRPDWYGVAEGSGERGTLHEHCMRAFRYADRSGENGLALMGAGDWNDGMNLVGARGKGESVWLSEFLSCAAQKYAEIADGSDREYLLGLSKRMRDSVEKNGWDGSWYLRAIDDNGNPLGSSKCPECRIDLISQAWAALNGQKESRVRQALDSAYERLVDRDAGLVKLLDPPFTGQGPNPGYISGYPAGVRENGAQYTHAACWLAAAFARIGDAKRAWEIFRMLLPVDRTDTREKAERYRAEPYVIAADLCSAQTSKGVAGWTWYTGAAGWTVKVMLEEILGLKIRGKTVRMRALLTENMQSAEITVRAGKSEYRLVSGDFDDAVDSALLVDDGINHEIHFPRRN